MQMPIIDKEEKAFRDPYIFASDVKAITIDNVLVNLFMLMRNNGARIKLMLKSGKFLYIRCNIFKVNIIQNSCCF